jgi:hypothetical protein
MNAAWMAARVGVLAIAALLAAASSAWAASALTVKLKSQHHSGVSATATLTTKDGATIVTIRIFGKSSADYFPDLRRGSCVLAAETPEIPLALASTKSPSETVIDVPVSRLTSSAYVVMLHAADGTLSSLSPDAAVACGQIRVRQPSSAVASAAPVTGIGTALEERSMMPLSLALLASAGGATFVARRLSSRGSER